MYRQRSFILYLFLLLFQPLFALPKQEVRAVWLTTNYGLDWPTHRGVTTAEVMRQKKDLTDQLDAAKKMNINLILFQTRLRGDLLYPSQLEPWNPIITDSYRITPSYNPLAFVVEECHKRGLQCHAWVVCMPVGTAKHVREHGRNSVVSRYPTLCKYYMGEWYFDPSNPAVASHLTAVTEEIVRNYDVDGIHLDYIRYPDDPTRFPDQANFKRRADKSKNLSQWRTENINRIVFAIYDKVKSIKPYVVVSSAPLGKHKSIPCFSSHGWSGVERVYQDAQYWMLCGKMDMVIPMLYYNHLHFYPFVIDWVENCNNRLVVPGLGLYQWENPDLNWSLDDFWKEMEFTRRVGAAGQSMYRMGNLMSGVRGVVAPLHKTFYLYPALLPPLSFISTEVPTVPQCQLNSVGDAALLTWQKVPTAMWYVVYSAPRLPIDITNPANIECVTIDNNYRIQSPYDYYCVTAINRYNNESGASPTFNALPITPINPVTAKKMEWMYRMFR